MTPDARTLPEARIAHVERATIVPMPSPQATACGVLDAHGAPVHAARTLLSASRFTPDPKPSETPATHLPGRWLFAGVGRHHFGHFLLEATPRLWALDHLSARPDGIALIPMAGRDIAAVLRRRLGPLMDILGQGLPVHLVETPVQVDEAIIPSQGFGHLHWTHGTPEARAYMRTHLCAAVPADGPEKLYVSRRRLKSVALQVPREQKIERWMSAAGFTVFHPERHSVTEQIARYRAARVIVGPDGSAFHLAPFVMQPGTCVGLIQRRTRQHVFDAIARQIAVIGEADLWTSGALSHLKTLPDNDALPPELHQLRAALRVGGFI
ncbi:MAG: glycosyltransferase 61 family protein [Allgaiera sp.]|jgi:capsular polysaccharide biosynthesis protein|nr:glycosyltransferase 61 family protein [Allgaiera sp.]